MSILVTGGSGFVGFALLQALAARSPAQVVAAVRRVDARLPDGVRRVVAAELSGQTDWSAALRGVDVVVHAAARVHVMRDAAADPLAEFRRVNVDGTLGLARQAARSGVRRFVFVSSIKVNGEVSAPGRPFCAIDPAAPVDAYGVSKHEAEVGLRCLAEQTGMEVVIVRPPLVYGPGVRGNFLQLMRWVRMGIPLPLGWVDNRRSLLALDNLVDFLSLCAQHPAAADTTFLISDGEDVSTPQLLRQLGKALDKPVRLFGVPSPMLRIGAGLVGQGAALQRLCGTLQVDGALARERLGWRPPIDFDEGLRRTTRGLLGRCG